MTRKLYNVKIGAQAINWVNDDLHDVGDFITFEQTIDEMHLAGYEGTELGRKYPRDPEVLKNELKKRDLVLTSGWGDVLFIDEKYAGEYIEKFKKHALFLKEMGCKYVVCCEVGNSTCWDPREDRRKLGVKKLNENQWKMLADGLNMLGAFCKENDMKLVYHVHNGTVIETAEETRKLCNMTDSDKLFILADTGHLYMCGVDVVKFFEDFADRIKYIHFKDIRQDVLNVVREHNLDFNSGVRVGLFTVPGDGCIDFVPIIDLLEKNGYQGWLVVEAEQNALYFNPLTYAKIAREYLRNITGI